MTRFLLIALLALPGCSALSAFSDATTPLGVYELRAPEDIPAAPRQRPYNVTVEMPTTTGALDTDRILIKPSPLAAEYLPEVRWGEDVPTMVQSLLLRSLQRTNALAYVGREPLGLSGDIAIVTDVIDFQAETAGEGALVRLALSIQLVRESDVTILASRTFTAEAASPTTETEALVAAFDTASDTLLRAFAAWVTDGLR
ncbi:ABC-type transport auxiliary lipoprotein family protein [Litorisediminicola beolgyonensis]|uniref:ABC-type transport auxiliary lipoprotein family protein n=1 Tax=Litorisediminicola beolgyonensis TaxID=1173614 RepID=A0ABW3ZLU2_9RHOB